MVDNYFQVNDGLPLSKRTPALKQKGERQHQIVQQFQPATKKTKEKGDNELITCSINSTHNDELQTLSYLRLHTCTISLMNFRPPGPMSEPARR